MSLVGRLEDIALSDIFQILSIGRKTGTLIIGGDKGNAFIVFKGGLIVRAETNLIEGTIGHDLVKRNLIKENILDLALKVKKTLPQKSIAEILLDLGSTSKELLDKAARKRIEGLMYHLLLIGHGDFKFELDQMEPSAIPGIEDTGWELSRGISAEFLLMEGARVHDEEMSKESLEDALAGEGGGDEWGQDEWAEEGRHPERKDISFLKSLTQELRFPNSTSEITLLILRFASDIFSRGVLFMVGEEDLTGLGQFGLEIERADEKIRDTTFAYGNSAFLKRIIDSGQSFKGKMDRDAVTELFIKETGGGWPPEVAFFPIITEGKVVALLYCDNAPAGDVFPETEGLEIFISQAGLALEKSLLQRKLQEMQSARGKPPL